jgi:hypothetical protein
MRLNSDKKNEVGELIFSTLREAKKQKLEYMI